MAEIIRNDTNYGNLAVIEMAGKRFVMEIWRAEMLQLPVVEIDEIPEFNPELTLSVCFPNGRAEAYAYIQENADVRIVAAALSKRTNYEVRVYAYARILDRYINGESQGERKITDFYSNLTPQQIGKVSY